MINASALSSSLGSNQNLELPRYPLLVPDLLRIRHSERAVVILGGNSPRLIEGRSVALIVDRMFPLLDGGMGRDAVCDLVRGFSPASVLDALYFLYAEGLLIEGDGRRRTPGTRASDFYDRYCDIKRNRGSGAEVVQALARSRVGLVSDADHLASARALVAAAGVGTIEAIDTVHFASFDGSPSSLAALRGTGVEELDLVVLVTPGLAHVDMRPLVRACRATGRPVLLVDTANPGIGPLVSPHTAACLACAFAQQGGDEATAALTENEHDYAHAMMASRIAGYLGDVMDTPIEASMLRFRASDMSWLAMPVHRLVDCRECAVPVLRDTSGTWSLGRPEEAARRLVEFFHVNSQERLTQAAKSSHLLSYTSGVRDSVAGAYKAYTRSTRFRLPVMRRGPSGFSGAFPARVGTTIAALVSWTDRLGDGTGDMRVRALPSAGNLASQSLYLVSSGTAGIPDGLHYCHPDGHLRVLGVGARLADIEAACGRRAGTASGERVYLVGTGALARLESKYRDKGYRFALQDAGVMLAGLLGLAHETGLDVESSGDFLDDRIGTLLGTCGVSEIVTFVACVRTSRATPTTGDKA